MSKILIVGAGQDGLYLGHRLLSQGHDVTVMTNQTSTEIRKGGSSVTAPTWHRVWELEKRAGLDLWSTQAPRFTGVDMSLRMPGQPALEFSGSLGSAGTAIERRVKMADWLEMFEDRKGKVIIQAVDLTTLYYFGQRGYYDLMIIAVGGGILGDLFDHDPSRVSGAHNRVMTQAVLHDVEWPDRDSNFDVISTPEGEVCLMPVLTAYGAATSVFATALPDRGLDCHVQGRPTQTALLSSLMRALQREVPDIYERCRRGQTVDEHAVIQKQVRPTVRHPVAALPQGGLVMGMADVVVSTDPVSAQAAANSTIYADIVADAVAERPEGPFDEEWIRAVDAKAWEIQGQHTGVLSNMVNDFWIPGRLPEHFAELAPAAMTYQEIADKWISGIGDPSQLAWMFDPDQARAYIAEVAARS
ncbi:MAG: oxygenase [Nocardiopsaceae bacterium]|nr:oxygenase [Nocardiopsaceae bacterium]